MALLDKVFTAVSKQKATNQQADEYRRLIRAEAVIGGQIFGDLPEGHHREFFCLDERTWVWHEEWIDMLGRRNVRTTRYDVRPDGILKAQDGSGYKALSEEEARNFLAATKIYREWVFKELYHIS